MVVTREWQWGDRAIFFQGTNLQRIVNKPWRYNAQYTDYRQQFCIIIIKHAKKLKLNYSNYLKDRVIMKHDRGANYCYNGNILQYINISN